MNYNYHQKHNKLIMTPAGAIACINVCVLAITRLSRSMHAMGQLFQSHIGKNRVFTRLT